MDFPLSYATIIAFLNPLPLTCPRAEDASAYLLKCPAVYSHFPVAVLVSNTGDMPLKTFFAIRSSERPHIAVATLRLLNEAAKDGWGVARCLLPKLPKILQLFFLKAIGNPSSRIIRRRVTFDANENACSVAVGVASSFTS